MILQITFNFLVFCIGAFGIILQRKNVLVLLMCIELMLLAVNLNFIIFSVYLDDMFGQIFALFILTVAAAESSLGLAILILYFRLRGNIFIEGN